MTNTRLFVFLVCFWTILTIFSNIFEANLMQTDITDLNSGDDRSEETLQQKTFLEVFFDIADKTPVVNYFVPILKILTMQYTAVPKIVAIFLNATLIFSIYIILNLRSN